MLAVHQSTLDTLKDIKDRFPLPKGSSTKQSRKRNKTERQNRRKGRKQ